MPGSQGVQKSSRYPLPGAAGLCEEHSSSWRPGESEASSRRGSDARGGARRGRGGQNQAEAELGGAEGCAAGEVPVQTLSPGPRSFCLKQGSFVFAPGGRTVCTDRRGELGSRTAQTPGRVCRLLQNTQRVPHLLRTSACSAGRCGRGGEGHGPGWHWGHVHPVRKGYVFSWSDDRPCRERKPRAGSRGPQGRRVVSSWGLELQPRTGIEAGREELGGDWALPGTAGQDRSQF